MGWSHLYDWRADARYPAMVAKVRRQNNVSSASVDSACSFLFTFPVSFLFASFCFVLFRFILFRFCFVSFLFLYFLMVSCICSSLVARDYTYLLSYICKHQQGHPRASERFDRSAWYQIRPSLKRQRLHELPLQ